MSLRQKLTLSNQQGTAPWELEYTIVGQKPQVIRNIQQPELSFSVPIPPSIASRGGQFAISLVSVKDANGCRKALSLDDLEVDVHRIVPTARFHGAGEDRKSTLLEGEKGRIPVRLAGEGVSSGFWIRSSFRDLLLIVAALDFDLRSAFESTRPERTTNRARN